MATAAANVVTFPAETQKPVEMTHEAFVHAVRAAVVNRVVDGGLRKRLLSAKLVYGSGPGFRGVCFYGAWQNGESHDFLEISATGEESFVQVAGTTIHELGHCLAGFGAGHGKEWKAACATLGLTIRTAGGQDYRPEDFDAAAWAAVESMPHPTDGKPSFNGVSTVRKPKPCPAGIGTRGGKSRGVGSGSRLRLWLCGCPEATVGRKVRVASDDWDATCNRCGVRYTKAGA